MEVGAQNRKLLLQKKIKLGWQICKIEDYVVANRCFKCSRFNHMFHDGREVTCPLCARTHTLNECAADPRTYKCTNCLTYNKHNLKKNMCQPLGTR
jgi:DNA-directed RNA polymerase subunit RPC12/RpoP